MKRTSFAFVFVFFFLAFAKTCALAQGTYTAASCNLSDVNAVINGPTHTAGNGDVIIIPAGSCTWTSGISVSGKGITIKGTGTPNSTPSTTGASASCTQTAITVNNVNHLFTLSPGTSTSLSRISCMKILTTNPSSVGPPITAWGSCTSSTCPNLRLDNISFDSSLQGCCASQSNSIITTDSIFGVIDHNTIAGPAGSTWPPMEFINYMNSAWNGVGDYGDNSWASPSNFGSSKLLYLENNAFGQAVIIGETEAQVNGHEGGGRIVGRFNTCNGCLSGLSNHGTDSNGRPRGGRQIEFYGNNFVCTNNASGCQGGVPVRSGVNLMFGNSLTASSGGWFNQYMALGAFRVNTIWAGPWNQCPGPYDQSSPLICLDQPSRSGGMLLSGNPPTPTGWSNINEALDPSYEWKDSGYNPVFGNVSGTSGVLQGNRDWYTDNSLGTPHAQTSPTSPFNGAPNGAVGMGFGTLANRPTSCTPRVGYWATDQGNWNQSGNSFGQGQLFVCTTANTWTLYYTPYTYPHPLTGAVTPSASPAPPTSLTVVTQ
jgi:hypothetical protein